jgi:tetratricopeptide (TPR) repeat protein
VLRTLLTAVAIVLAALAGAVQLASSAAYGDLSARPSLPAALHDRVPKLLRGFIGGARARAAAAIHEGDLATADRLVATLPDDAESADLRGRIAQARGDRDGAIAAYVRAGDVVRAQALIDTLAASDPARALADQERLVAALRDDAGAAEITGEAWWRLGQLQAAAGYRDASRRRALWREAETSYERALALAPNEETYLLAAGYQALANGEVGASRRFYERAAEVVPNSADAWAGLAWSSAAAKDCAGARAALARARALRAAATGPAVRDPLDDPNAGPALKRCTTMAA